MEGDPRLVNLTERLEGLVKNLREIREELVEPEPEEDYA